jgi:hypothetical protein
MTVQTVLINGQPVLVEVVPQTEGDRLPAEAAPAAAPRAGRGNVDYEEVSLASDLVEAAGRIKSTLSAVLSPIQQAGEGFTVSEWTVELSFGFKGGAGIPFLVNGEANGAIKVSAKWKGKGP